jgi:hypothetical protein
MQDHEDSQGPKNSNLSTEGRRALDSSIRSEIRETKTVHMDIN